MILHGDCLEKLKDLADNSVDCVVTDPPYGLKFMGKKWDYDVPCVAVWKEVIRVLKPGGHCLSFGGTRTYHRLVSAIEDAGFEIRDQIQWIYGSGFPKSHNIGDGIGTALKPANEPICIARKPLEKGLTVAQNVLKWGCGGLNIDGTRIESESRKHKMDSSTKQGNKESSILGKFNDWDGSYFTETKGRWPANVIFDEAAAEMLDEQSLAGGMHSAGSRRAKGLAKQTNDGAMFGVGNHEGNDVRFGDSGGASRFFYVAKASKRERGEGNNHPTVKPVKLMEYLITLVCPPSGTVLDPFMGSGSTGIAAKNLERGFIGIELNEEYINIAEQRIANG